MSYLYPQFSQLFPIVNIQQASAKSKRSTLILFTNNKNLRVCPVISNTKAAICKIYKGPVIQILEMKVIILLTILFHLLLSQGIQFSILPDATYNQSQASAQACYANCQSCQTLTNQCEQCYSPYFIKAQDGSCQLAASYTLQSSTNEIMAGNAFIYTSESWGTIQQTDCKPNSQYLNSPLRILGPFAAGTNVTYQRSVSFHQYLILRFELIKMGWDNTSKLTISILDQGNSILTSQKITNTPGVASQILCSSTQIDQRFSVAFKVGDRAVTTLSAKFQFSGKGSWGIATWVLISGTCDSSCSNCSYSRDPTQCIGCNSFFIMGSDSKCSQCYTGFHLVTTNSVQSCQKCSIQFLNCNPGQAVCFYSGLSDQLNSSNCKFLASSDYSSTYDIDTPQFPGSLFTAAGKPATYLCGMYSIAGPAQTGDPITRIFATLPLHYTISITFNIFIVDQSVPSRNNLFVIILDNIILEASYITTQGVSDLCGSTSLEAFVTYPSTIFYPHNNTNNVNLTITSNATNWGIRNVRFAYQVCDSTCLQCGVGGCLQCQGYFTLQGLVCKSCPTGFGIQSIGSSNTCIQCVENCLACKVNTINSTAVTTCLQCTLPYFLFEANCVKRTNVANILAIGNSGPSAGTWSVQSSPTVANNTCSINLPSRSNTSTVNFTVSENKMTSLINISQAHYKKIVEFYLIKIDTWDPSDLLQLYLNDLLVLSKNYTAFGNSICFESAQTDFISFQSIQIVDSNSSLSISFEVVTAIGNTRRFGVSNFKVSPVGCQNCQDYPFQYKIDYNYDNALNIHLQFNRIYVNNNITLFQQIFWLLINGNKIDYSVVWNNSVTYIIQSYPNFEALKANITVICKYPQLVQTNTQNTINDKPFFTARLLQSGASYSTLKIIDNSASYTPLARYTPPSNANTINGIRIFFDVVSRAVIYLGFAFFFIGCQTPCTHFMHNIQKMWLHIFVAALAAPSALRYAFIGFRQTQGQNIAIHPSSWQSALPYELYYNTPSYYEEYYTDVGFFRNIYNIAIAFLILGVVSIVFNILLGKCDISRNFKDSIFWRHMRVTFVKRPFFVFNSIVFYQYLSLVLVCTLQFTAIHNQTNQGSFGGINAAGAVVAFILATIYPLIHFYYLKKKRADLEGEEHKIQYANRYGQIFYRFLPRDVWMEQKPGITYAEQIYNLYRFGEIWWMCIIATAMHNSPQAQCFLLMITNLIHLVVILFTTISQSLYFKLGKVFELAFFAGLQILILVCQSQQETLTTRSLNTLGSVGIALLFAIIFLSFMRSIYTFVKIYKEYSPDTEHSKYANIKTRNEDYFTVKGDEPLPSERD